MPGEIGERRSGSRRESVNLLIAGRVPATPIAVHLLDLSKTGCKIQSPDAERIARGATILLAISNLSEVEGQIVWQKGDRFGIKFHEEISEELIQQVIGDSAHRDSSGPDLLDSFGRTLPSLGSKRR
jgi:hypothetical protein